MRDRKFRIRRQIQDRLSVWRACGWSVQWVNLTSARSGSPKELMRHFLSLRRMMATRLTVPVEHCGVRTTEGHGVLHLLMAAKVVRGKAWSTVCSQVWLSETWGRLHGAPIVWIGKVGQESVDAARISRYMISQYMADGQGDALADFFQSQQKAWEGFSIPSLRRQMWELVKSEWRLLSPGETVSLGLEGEYVARLRRRGALLRQLWRHLLEHRWFDLEGERYFPLDGRIQRV